MDDKIRQYRQPLITLTGIILGFALNVSAEWVPKSFLSNYVAEIILAIGTLIHIPLYIIVVYRILNPNPKANPESYYRTTLFLLLTGICIFYITIIGIMIESYIVRRG
jgi:hypothetical protein